MKDLIHSNHSLLYTKLISGIDGKNIKLEDVRNNTSKKIFCLRHDIDKLVWFPMAIKIAKIEYYNNIKSTYCIKSSDVSFFSKNTIRACKKIMNLGHSINLHLNIVNEYMNKKQTIRSIIDKYLSFLRTKNIEVRGVSAHGSPENYIYGFNYEFWEEFDPSKFQGVNKLNFDKVSLSDFNLDYEATFIGHDAYLSDKLDTFFGYFLKDFDVVPFDTIAAESKHNKGLKVIDEFNKMEQGFLQINIHAHPNRWSDLL